MQSRLVIASEESLKELNHLYAYSSLVSPERVSFSEAERAVRMPVYRYDLNQETARELHRLKWEYSYPIFYDLVEIRNVAGYSFKEREVATEFCHLYRIVYRGSKKEIRFNTDFPFPLRVTVDELEMVVHFGEQVVGTYREVIDATLILLHYVEYKIDLLDSEKTSS